MSSSSSSNSLQNYCQAHVALESISHRLGPNRSQVPYLKISTVINLANDGLGVTGWNSEIKKGPNIDYVLEINNRWDCGVHSIIRITLIESGAYREDIGYGYSRQMLSKAEAIEKAMKESISDGIKRTMKQLGNQFGNSIEEDNKKRKTSELPSTPSSSPWKKPPPVFLNERL